MSLSHGRAAGTEANLEQPNLRCQQKHCTATDLSCDRPPSKATSRCLAALGFGRFKPQRAISPTVLSCAAGDGLTALSGRTAQQTPANDVAFGADVAPVHR
jgi:hypothetical protein